MRCSFARSTRRAVDGHHARRVDDDRAGDIAALLGSVTSLRRRLQSAAAGTIVAEREGAGRYERQRCVGGTRRFAFFTPKVLSRGRGTSPWARGGGRGL